MSDYYNKSLRIQAHLRDIVKSLIRNERTKYIKITTNLRCGLPTKDIHKIAGPLIDEWAYEALEEAMQDPSFGLKMVVSKLSSSLEDIFVQLELDGEPINVLIDIKSASLEKGTNAGKGSNLTSFRKIRPFYEDHPDANFFILSIKHNAYIVDGQRRGFELVDCNIFDLKLVANAELKLNKRMGDQFQISNSMHVTQVDRTTEEFIEMIDEKYIAAYSRESFHTLLEKIETAREFSGKKDKLLQMLKDSPLSKKEIVEELDLSGSQYTRLLNMLKEDDLIYSPKRGVYAFNPDAEEE